jgi:hypothetical protein
MIMLSSSCSEYFTTIHFVSLFYYRQFSLTPRLSLAWPHYVPIIRLVSSVSYCQFNLNLRLSSLLPHDSAIVNLFSPFDDRRPGFIIL